MTHTRGMGKIEGLKKEHNFATEQRLNEAAMDLIDQNDVLVGLNHDTTYHYFGPRRELLRATIPDGLKHWRRLLSP